MLKTMQPLVKILGERNSGTNFAAAVLSLNFDVSVIPQKMELTPYQNFVFSRRYVPARVKQRLAERYQNQSHTRTLAALGGWKHAALTPEYLASFGTHAHTRTLCVVRHPVSWVRSMHKNPFHAIGTVPKDFEDFIAAPWPLRPRDELGKAPLRSPLVLWEKKVRSYLAAAAHHKNVCVVKYEDLLLQPEKTTDSLSGFLGPLTGPVRLPKATVRAFGGGEGTADSYIKKVHTSTLGSLSLGQTRIFEQHISAELMQKFSYS